MEIEYVIGMRIMVRKAGMDSEKSSSGMSLIGLSLSKRLPEIKEAKKFPLCEFLVTCKNRKGESSSLIEALDYNSP